MNIIETIEIVHQDYSDCDSGIPSHWVAIVHHTGTPFAVHVYADKKSSLKYLKVDEEFKDIN